MGIVDCYVKTIRADGVRGLYGFWISCSLHLTSRPLLLRLYDTLKAAVLGANTDWIYTSTWAGRDHRVRHPPTPGHGQEADDDSGPGVKYSSSWGLRQGARQGGQGGRSRAGVNCEEAWPGRACCLAATAKQHICAQKQQSL